VYHAVHTKSTATIGDFVKEQSPCLGDESINMYRYNNLSDCVIPMHYERHQKLLMSTTAPFRTH